MKWIIAIVAVATSVIANPVVAKTVIIEMKDQGKDGMMVFEPGFVKAAPGDIIRFVPTNPSHNAESIAGMIPVGAVPMKGRFNQAVEMKVTITGLYAIKCLPHYSLGMVALIQIGKNPNNIASVRDAAMPPFAKARMKKFLAQVK